MSWAAPEIGGVPIMAAVRAGSGTCGTVARPPAGGRVGERGRTDDDSLRVPVWR